MKRLPVQQAFRLIGLTRLLFAPAVASFKASSRPIPVLAPVIQNGFPSSGQDKCHRVVAPRL